MVIVFFLFWKGIHPCSQSIEVNSLTPDGNGVISGQTIIKYVINRRTKTRGFGTHKINIYVDQVLDTQIPPPPSLSLFYSDVMLYYIYPFGVLSNGIK